MKLLFYIVAVWLTTLVDAQDCRSAGQVFFTDAIDRTISVKTDSGDLVNFNYDDATSFRIARSGSQQDTRSNRVSPEQLNNGDRLCVGTAEPLVVTVTPRRKVEAEQQKEL